MDAPHGPDDHTWTPVDGQAGRYACACGAAGWRHLRTGQIRLAQHAPRSAPTVGLSSARSSYELFATPINPTTNDPDRRS